MRIICLFKLKDGVEIDAYEDWAVTCDIPTVNSLGTVTRFTVHKAIGMLGDDTAAPPYDYVEVIDIEGMDAFLAEVASDELRKVSETFRGFADSPQFILTKDL